MSAPFHWTSQCDCQGDGKCHAAHGWYQWQSTGLVYLGESMLDDATFGKQEIYA